MNALAVLGHHNKNTNKPYNISLDTGQIIGEFDEAQALNYDSSIYDIHWDIFTKRLVQSHENYLDNFNWSHNYSVAYNDNELQSYSCIDTSAQGKEWLSRQHNTTYRWYVCLSRKYG